jgi:hypothetical protein
LPAFNSSRALFNCSSINKTGLNGKEWYIVDRLSGTPHIHVHNHRLELLAEDKLISWVYL